MKKRYILIFVLFSLFSCDDFSQQMKSEKEETQDEKLKEKIEQIKERKLALEKRKAKLVDFRYDSERGTLTMTLLNPNNVAAFINHILVDFFLVFKMNDKEFSIANDSLMKSLEKDDILHFFPNDQKASISKINEYLKSIEKTPEFKICKPNISEFDKYYDSENFNTYIKREVETFPYDPKLVLDSIPYKVKKAYEYYPTDWYWDYQLNTRTSAENKFNPVLLPIHRVLEGGEQTIIEHRLMEPDKEVTGAYAILSKVSVIYDMETKIELIEIKHFID